MIEHGIPTWKNPITIRNGFQNDGFLDCHAMPKWSFNVVANS